MVCGSTAKVAGLVARPLRLGGLARVVAQRVVTAACTSTCL